jgi:hypothetical protein
VTILGFIPNLFSTAQPLFHKAIVAKRRMRRRYIYSKYVRLILRQESALIILSSLFPTSRNDFAVGLVSSGSMRSYSTANTPHHL